MWINNQVIIENDCWIGVHISIVGNVRIGKHSTIAAGAVVTKGIPPYCVAGGYQQKLLKNMILMKKDGLMLNDKKNYLWY